VARCDYCHKQIIGLPYNCRYCGGTFCVEHHLPENHECPGLVRGPTGKWFRTEYADRGWELYAPVLPPPSRPVAASKSRPLKRSYEEKYVVPSILYTAVLILFLLPLCYIIFTRLFPTDFLLAGMASLAVTGLLAFFFYTIINEYLIWRERRLRRAFSVPVE